MDPAAACDALRTLDRRLLALAGDVDNLVADGRDGRLGPAALLPNEPEITRADLEIAEVWAELAELSHHFGIEVVEDAGDVPRTLNAETARLDLADRTEQCRQHVRSVFGQITARHPALGVAPLTDDTAVFAGDVAGFHRHWSLAAIVMVLFVGIVVAVWAASGREADSVATRLCATPSLCPDEAPSYQRLKRLRKEHSFGLWTYVVLSRSDDCTHDVEYFFRPGPVLGFHGSVDDPDTTRRAEFEARRNEVFENHVVVGPPLPCAGRTSEIR